MVKIIRKYKVENLKRICARINSIDLALKQICYLKGKDVIKNGKRPKNKLHSFKLQI